MTAVQKYHAFESHAFIQVLDLLDITKKSLNPQKKLHQELFNHV